MHCITANMLQTNKVDARCDKLATELSRQHFKSEVANFQLLHLHLTYATCIWRLRWSDPVWVFQRSLASEFLGHPSCGVVCLILRSAVSVEQQLVTDRHDNSCHLRLAGKSCSAVSWIFAVLCHDILLEVLMHVKNFSVSLLLTKTVVLKSNR